MEFSFQNYKILHLIGQGSFGKVFKASDIEAKTDVALKILIKVSLELRVLLEKLKYFHFSGEDRRRSCRL